MGDMRKLQDDLKRIENDIAARIMPMVREAQAAQKQATDLFNAAAREMMLATGQINKAVQMTIMPTVNEIESEGGGVIGRRKRSTNLEVDETEVKTQSKKADKAAAPIKEKGKRYCGNCGQGGHRRTTCPN